MESKNSGKKYLFQCDNCEHDFDKSLNSIVGNNGWCPYCCNQKICIDKNCQICFEKSFASYDGKTTNGELKINCWHSTKNGELTPRNLIKRSIKKCWFQCDNCPHSFISSMDNIISNSWCPYCCIPSKQFCDDKNCNHCFEKSFASYKDKTVNGKLKIDCWHPQKNGKNYP